MASNKPNTFKTPQKTVGSIHRSPPVKYHRFRSPLANIQMSSVTSSSQYTSGSPMLFVPQSQCTPPQPFFKIRNPFEKTLIDHLHTPICSPGMFKIRESSGSFKWDIEHMSIMKPADIVPCNSQFDPTPDPAMERKATEAIDKFFSQGMIVPSPLNEPTKQTNVLPMDPPDEHATPEGTTKITSREVWTQTMLTIPMELPPEVENALKPFYTFTKDQNGIGEADISANASLRRKLCFEEVFSDGEDEHHTSFHNTSCPILHSPHMTAFLSGMKRTFGTPSSTDNGEDTNTPRNPTCTPTRSLSTEDLHRNLADFSPILEEASKRHNSYSGSETCMGSPSISPIGKSPLQENNIRRISPKISPDKQENLHHSCVASPFSQSTPEKSSLTSKSSTKSSPELTDGSDSDTKLGHVKKMGCFNFTEEICQVLRKEGMVRRSKSETSVSSLGRSRSAMKLDFNMDISSDVSMNFSGDHSLVCHSIMGDSDSPSPKPTSNSYWDMEMAQLVSKTNSAKQSSCVKCDANETTVDTNFKLFIKPNVCDCNSAIDDESNRLRDVYQYLTPTKDKQCPKREHYLSISKSSPTRMSLDNSFNIDSEKHTLTNQTAEFSGNISHLTSQKPFSYPEIGRRGTVFHRMDSGFNDLCLSNNSILPSCDVTVCNSTRLIEVTKSFCNTETSSVSWKRFDSGFNEEASSDFSHQISCNEIFKPPTRKHSPILEYSENKENIYFDDFHKIIDRGQHIHDSMSISEIFAEDMVSFNCNFSSTPSKSLRQNNK